MERMPARFPLPLPLALVAIALAACLSDSARYRPGRDDTAMVAIASTFHDPGSGLTLSLCEDVAAGEGWEPECRFQHVVQGGGRGRSHDEDWSTVGCGGCLFRVVAYVHGTVDGGPFAAPAAVRGIVMLQSGHDDNPYGFPYRVLVRCEGDASCQIGGDLRADGVLPLSVTVGADPATDVTATREGAAACL